jgi:integrase
MARTLHKLSAVKLASLKDGYHGDGGGLYHRVAGKSHGWIFRFGLGGRVRDAGLGSYPTISLRRARELAAEYRQAVVQGIDPIASRDAKRAAQRVADSKTISFDDVARQYVESHADGWRNRKHEAQWRATIATYASPVIGRLPVAAVDTGAIMRILQPIWKGKVETASRLRGRLEAILAFAQVRGYRPPNEINPAAWKNHLSHLLPAKGKVRQVKHHSALDYRKIPAFMHALRQQGGVAARALEFLILTGTRTSETLNMTWNEVDVRVWTVPSVRMKAGREFRVPLSDAALAVLQDMKASRRGDYVFEGSKQGRPLSQMSLWLLLRRMGLSNTVHGFRAALSTWASEVSRFENHIIELSLAHTVGTQVERAYKRGDLLARRAELMAAWATYCSTAPSARDAKVVLLGGRRK